MEQHLANSAPGSKTIVRQCQRMNAPWVHVRVRNHKARISEQWLEWHSWVTSSNEINGPQRSSGRRHKSADARETDTLRAASDTEAVGCCMWWFMSAMWWMTFRSFPFYHISEKFSLPQAPFCSPIPRLQMASTHTSPLFGAHRKHHHSLRWLSCIQLSLENLVWGALTSASVVFKECPSVLLIAIQEDLKKIMRKRAPSPQNNPSHWIRVLHSVACVALKWQHVDPCLILIYTPNQKLQWFQQNFTIMTWASRCQPGAFFLLVAK